MALVAGPLGAYEGGPVEHGGTVTGTVRLAGAPPPPAPARPVTVDAATCGAEVPDESLLLGRAGGVRNAVVALADVTRGRGGLRPEGVTVDNRGCRFVPRVQVVQRGEKVQVRTSDPVLHNAHAWHTGPKEVSLANLALSQPGQTMDLGRRLASRLPPSGESIVSLRCDVHPWMAAWLVVLDHPYGTVTDAEGRFELPEVPPGSYRLVAWHERLGRAERPVTVGPDGRVDVEVTFPASR